jgi:cold shock CspA family protein
MELPDVLVNSIQKGEAVLFLGSGASLDAVDGNGNTAPSVKVLIDSISDTFLSGKYKNYSLQYIAELAINENSLSLVQLHLKGLFENLQPTRAHMLVPLFDWLGIATTNYDTLIEQGYHANAKAKIAPFISDNQHVEVNLRNGATPLLKLHGCITRTDDPNCPLILTPDQYLAHRTGRTKLFRRLEDWGGDHSIVFVGHSLEDPDIRNVLNTLYEYHHTRPQYFLVGPSFDDIHARLWGTKRTTVLNGTFDDFMSALESRLDTALKRLKSVPDETPAIFKGIPVPYDKLSSSSRQLFESDVDYVSNVKSCRYLDPKSFYKGVDDGWSAILQNLDVRRKLEDDLLLNHIIDADVSSKSAQFVLIKGYAGSGKSIFLKRLAWESAHTYDAFCLYIRPHGVLNAAALGDLLQVWPNRIFIFLDDIGSHLREVYSIFKNLKEGLERLTIITVEEPSNWNVSCQELSPYVTEQYELRNLSEKEALGLLDLLETHRSLGELKRLTIDERLKSICQRAGRQLLVALHEATHGKTFEEIIEEEYKGIVPFQAQQIYNTICVLNRLEVPVRAGVISRVHGITFEQFRGQFFAPLEGIVQTIYNKLTRDYEYSARHSSVASMVFNRILSKQEDRYHAYIKCFKGLDVSFQSDRTAFKLMTKAKGLLDLFSNHELVNNIYREAEFVSPDDAQLKHQIAIYEMKRASGNLENAKIYLMRAQELAPYDPTIPHTFAEYKFLQARKARTPLEAAKYVKEAEAVTNSLVAKRGKDAYSYHTMAKLLMFKIDQARLQGLENEEQEHIIALEELLIAGLQRYPDDGHLKEQEAHLAERLEDEQRRIAALEGAFLLNKRRAGVAIHLARLLTKVERQSDAEKVLRDAIEENHNDARLNYAYAKLLISIGDTDPDTLLFHLRRASNSGDENYDAKLLYGKHLYLLGKRDEYDEVVRGLKKCRVGFEFRIASHYEIAEDFFGCIVKIEATYLFISRDGAGDWVYCHYTKVPDSVWRVLVTGTRVKFRLAFSLNGAHATCLDPIAIQISNMG